MEDDDNKDLLEQGKVSINKTSGEQYSSEDSDGSLSLSPPLLPENLHSEKTVENEALSDSSISEHLNSNSDSIENDRSDQEIEVSNLPSNISLLQEIIRDDEVISSKKFDDDEAQSRAHSILEEILKSEHFKLDSERTLQKSDFSLDSSNNSFNIFDGVNLNDSLIHNYEKNSNKSNSELSSANLSASLRDKHDEGLKVKQLEELLNVKESTIVALTAELESLKEITSSNQSASSFNTSTTDYKFYQDEFQNKVVEFQNALAHRDSVIQQLTEALQQSVINREELAHQSEYFSHEIIKLKNQLSETTEILNQNKSNLSAQKLSTTNVSVQNANSPINADDSESCSMFSNEQPEGDGDQSVLNYELQCSKLEETLNEAQINLMNDLKEYINSFVLQKTSKYKNANENELKILQDKLEKEKMDYETEIGRLKNLLTSIQGDSIEFVAFRAELESKHAKEMEELRTYFEKKCADLEKNYSEEIFSQQSRKMSGSSSCSETSEFMYSNTIPHSGPGGDTVRICVDATKYECSDLNKNDVIKLKANLSAISVDLNKYDFKNITKEDVDNIKLELKKYDFRGLLKYDLSLIKAEIQNKYHAELEILREDYENRIDTLHVEHSNRLQNTERRYTDQIESLKFDLDQALKNMNVNTVPSVASSGDFELTEVVESYERRLQEQVNMAKIDIINALEHQIQILVTTPVEDTEWPAELLQLKNKFTEKYENDIRALNEKHEEEVIKLKEEHRKSLTGTIARAKRRSIADESQSDLDVIKERDNLKKTTTVLRHLIGELMNYFSECEQELNNTIVEELLKHGFDKDLTELEVEINLNESSTSTYSDSVTSSLKKKVHIAPKFDELMATIDNSIPSSLDSNISIDLKNELGACLKRLRDDANAILAVSNNRNEPRKSTDNEINEVGPLIQVKLNSLTEQLVKENQIKKELVEELEESKNLIQNLEIERVTLETQVEELISQQKVFESDLNKAKEKISELIENGHKEIVSEGYGKKSSINLQSLGSRIVTLSELQERVRSMVVEINDRPDNPLLQVVEELCREGDRITEEAKNDHDDLQQQIDAADKKLRATCKFLEEQASEREQERDEAQKEIVSLQEQLKERDRDRVSCERINKEIEHLEQQMREMTKLMDENEKKTKEIELEKKEAIDKIYVLRDIIRDLETQVETKTSSEAELQAFISQLENIIKQQNKTNEELTQNLSSVRNISEAEDLQEIVKELESEIKALKLNLEFAGNEGLFKQIKTELNEFELNIDKCTRDLEALHSSISTTSCSSPSEDMSVRDQICSKTPLQSDDCEVPLQQLARLKEKLVKHSRAEGAAVKRIRDLEMEVAGIRHDLDDVQNERDLLQDQVSEQLVLVSSLQMRLDDQRLRAEQFQKQTNNSLEMRIYDLENEVKSLVDSVNARDKTIKHMTKTVEDTKKRLSDREEELHTNLDAQIITELHNEIQKLRSENESLLVKMNKDAQSAQVLPNLVDNILADKNKDIDMLRDKLDRTQSELNTFLSLNLDHEQLKALSRLHSSERAFSDILSLIEPENIRAEKLEESLSGSINPEQYKRNSNETTILGPGVPYQPDFSTIENLQKSRNYESTPLPKSNSTEIPKSSEKRVHFNDSVYGDVIDKLQAEIIDLKNELFNKEEIINEFTDRLKILKELEIMIEKLQQKLDSTEESLEKTTKTFEKEQKESRELQKNLGVELAEKKMNCIDLEKKLELLEEDSTRKDQMYINLAKEKRDIEKVLNQLKENNEHYKKLDVVVSENESEILSLREQLSSIGNHVEKIRSLELELDLKNLELTKLQEEVDSKSNSLEEYKQKLFDSLNENKEKDEFNSKLQKDIKNKESQLDLLNSKVENLQETIEGKNKQIEDLKVNLKQVERTSLSHLELKIKELKNIVLDRETEIEILNEDTVRYQDDLANLENKLKAVKDSVAGEYELKLAQGLREVAAKELKIVKIVTDLEDYEREINHLRGIVNEKDKIINQMSIDTKSLHVNLETIQTKMQESGNVVDLKKRLEDEQQLNSSLREEIDSMKSFNVIDTFKSAGMSESVEAIAGEVKKQLDYSDHLDSNILNALGACDNLGSLAQSNDINLLKQILSKEMYLHQDLKNKKESLEVELLQLKDQCKVQNDNVLILKELLEKEKENSNNIQLEDANMIEQLHTRLSRALENENEFEKLLEFEKRGRQNLENQLESLSRRISNMSSENSKTELTEYKSLPNPDSMELLKLRGEIQALHKENSTMKSDLKNLKRGKSDLEAHLKYIEDMLKFKNEELENIKKEVDTIKESEINAQTNLYSCKVELEQRTKEVENSRALMAEFEADSVQMRNQIARLQDNLNKSSNMQGDLNNLVPEKFVNKIKELTGSLKEYAKNNKEMSEIVDKLTTERTILQERVSELEQLNNMKLPYDDPVGKVNHLFARYLRSDSYRKALIWQKRYLVALLATYQSRPLFSTEIPVPYQNNAVANHRHISSGKQRFKAVVVGVVAVIRMQYLVRRWNSGKRGFHYGRPYRTHSSASGAKFQVGKPVSSQYFPISQVLTPTTSNTPNAAQSKVPTRNPSNQNFVVQNYHQVSESNDENLLSNESRPRTPTNFYTLQTTWSGATPPSRDQQSHFNIANPLIAPALLSQCLDGFDEVKHRLGMSIDKKSTTRVSE